MHTARSLINLLHNSMSEFRMCHRIAKLILNHLIFFLLCSLQLLISIPNRHGLIMNLLPIFPDVWLISYCCLFPVTHNRCLDHLLIFQNLFCFIFLCKISNQRKQIFILALLIDQFFISSDSLTYWIKFTFAQAFSFMSTNWYLIPRSLKKRSAFCYRSFSWFRKFVCSFLFLI